MTGGSATEISATITALIVEQVSFYQAELVLADDLREPVGANLLFAFGPPGPGHPA
jgi:hypothetical protein